MKKIVFDKPVTLVGVGCSHTQGCAFATMAADSTDEKTIITWASEKLREKYGEECTPEFITNNLTWMSKLKKHIPITEIINFGFGGFGTTTSLRAVKNYISLTPDLRNHLFIFQLQSTFRNEVLWKGDGTVRMDSARHFISFNTFLDKKFLNNVSTFLIDEQMDTYMYMLELFYLQNILENLGAEVRFFYNCFYSPILIDKSTSDMISNAFYIYKKASYEKELTGPPTFDDFIKQLNIIDLSNIGDKLVPRPTLHNEGLLEEDHHLSEKGNEIVAESLFENINNKVPTNIFRYEILS